MTNTVHMWCNLDPYPNGSTGLRNLGRRIAGPNTETAVPRVATLGLSTRLNGRGLIRGVQLAKDNQQGVYETPPVGTPQLLEPTKKRRGRQVII